VGEHGSSVALLGGTFNPVHLGHLGIARAAREEIGYDLVVFVPAMTPVHKVPDETTAAEHRLAMLHLATEGIEGVKVDECEIVRGGKSFTIETVEHVYESYDLSGKPGLIIGDDLLAGFSHWKRVDELAEMVDIIVARRTSPGAQDLAYPHRYLSNPIFRISSREIRALVRDGKSFADYLPPRVADYIEHNGLYRRGID